MTDGEFLKFRTDFGKVLQYIKYSKDKDKLYRVTHEGDRFADIDADSAELINVVTESNLKYEAKGDRVNMCMAIDEMRMESRNEGITEGRNEGRIEGKIEGRIEGVLDTLSSLVKKGLLSLTDAAREAGITPAEFQAKMVEVESV